MIEQVDSPQVSETPNGCVTATECVPMQIAALRENIEPFVLDESPDILTVGRRRRKHRYGFHWDPFSVEPYFVTPNGEYVKLHTVDDVPYLCDELNVENAPSVGPGMLTKFSATMRVTETSDREEPSPPPVREGASEVKPEVQAARSASGRATKKVRRTPRFRSAKAWRNQTAIAEATEVGTRIPTLARPGRPWRADSR